MNRTIPQELATKIVWFCSRRNVQAEEIIISKDGNERELFIISRGEFKVHDSSAGEDFVHAILSRGDVFGEMAFLDNIKRSASVTATCPGSLLVMGEKEFDMMLTKEPKTAVQFVRFLSGIVSGRLRIANDALLNLAFGDGALINKEYAQLKDSIAEMNASVRMELGEEEQTV